MSSVIISHIVRHNIKLLLQAANVIELCNVDYITATKLFNLIYLV